MTLPTVNFLSQAFRQSPHSFFTKVRAAGGLAKIENFGAYLVADHASCEALLKDPRIAMEQTDPVEFPANHPLAPYFTMRQKLMLFQNAPAHQSLRQPTEETFSAKFIKRWEPLIRDCAQRHLSQLEGRSCVDFVREISLPFVSEVICRVVGFPVEEVDSLATMTQEIADGLDPLGPYHSKVRAGQGYLEFQDYIEQQRQTLPSSRSAHALFDQPESFLGAVAHCPHALGFQSKEDLTATTVMLLAAGHQTTNHSLALSVQSLLAECPETLRWKSTISPLMVEELFRYHCPAQLTRRTVREELEVEGRRFPKGTALWLALASANRDEAVFKKGQELDFQRRPNKHLSFGAGSHFCLGSTLARLQLRLFLEELSGTFPNLRVAKGGVRPDPNLIFRGLKELKLEWSLSKEHL